MHSLHFPIHDLHEYTFWLVRSNLSHYWSCYVILLYTILCHPLYWITLVPVELNVYRTVIVHHNLARTSQDVKLMYHSLDFRQRRNHHDVFVWMVDRMHLHNHDIYPYPRIDMEMDVLLVMFRHVCYLDQCNIYSGKDAMELSGHMPRRIGCRIYSMALSRML